MRKSKKMSFKELVMQNKLELMNDKKAIERIEDKFEQKHAKNL
ncbi:FbpB family small basic protein [Bacillus sp. NTK071]|nr:FbpB family small basic protein [Bacillus sp. NTK071]MBN8207567.1 FbpB family small basic protein [Bacillus sp. NTK071]